MENTITVIPPKQNVEAVLEKLKQLYMLDNLPYQAIRILDEIFAAHKKALLQQG